MIALLIAAGLAAEPAPEPDPGAEAMEAYLAGRVAVVERSVTSAYAPAYDGSGRFWYVEQGARTLDAPTFAALTDDADASERLQRRRRGRALGAVGSFAVGTALGFAGLFGGAALRGDDRSAGSTALWASATAVPPAVGIGLGTALLGRSVRSAHPSEVYTRDEAEQRARSYNEALREELFDE